MLMVVALYKLPDVEARVCLGVRFGKLGDLEKLEAGLLRQARTRYPEFFAGMKPKQIKKVVAIQVYDPSPDANGLPRRMGIQRHKKSSGHA